MKKIIVIVIITSLLFGCTAYMATQLEEVRGRNRINLIKLELGMSKSDVLSIVGTSVDTLKSDQPTDKASSRIINNPYKSSAISIEDKSIEILYYYTDLKSDDGAITDDELTPIVLINGKVTGWGWDYWHDTAQKYEIRIR